MWSMSHSSFSAHRLYTATLSPVFMSIRFTVMHHVRSEIQLAVFNFEIRSISNLLVLGHVPHWWFILNVLCIFDTTVKIRTLHLIKSPLTATVLDTNSTYGEDRRRREPSCCTPRYPDVPDTTSTWDWFPDPVGPGWLRSARWRTDTGTGSLTWWFHCGNEPCLSVWKKNVDGLVFFPIIQYIIKGWSEIHLFWVAN